MNGGVTSLQFGGVPIFLTVALMLRCRLSLTV